MDAIAVQPVDPSTVYATSQEHRAGELGVVVGGCLIEKRAEVRNRLGREEVADLDEGVEVDIGIESIEVLMPFPSTPAPLLGRGFGGPGAFRGHDGAPPPGERVGGGIERLGAAREGVLLAERMGDQGEVDVPACGVPLAGLQPRERRVRRRGRPCRRRRRGLAFACSRLQRQELDPIRQVFGSHDLGDERQILDHRSDCHLMEVCVDDPSERGSFPLPPVGLGKEVSVIRQEDPSQRSGAIEQFRIRESIAAVLLRREQVHALDAERDRDGAMDMNVEEEADAHSFRPRARSFSRTGDGPADFRASW